MTKRLRIAVADDEEDMREYFQRILPHLGHEVVAVAQTGRDLVRQCADIHPDLVLTDIKMPELDGIEAANLIAVAVPVPIILVSAYHDAELIERAEQDHVLAYLIKPIKQADLEAAIAIAMRRFEQFQQLQHEAADLRQALADRKLIERAKGVLMRRSGLDEQESFRRMQRMSSERNAKLVEIARAILLAEEAYTPTNGG